MDSRFLKLFSILFTVFESIRCDYGFTEQGPSLYCTDLTPQNNVDIDQVRKCYFPILPINK